MKDLPIDPSSFILQRQNILLQKKIQKEIQEKRIWNNPIVTEYQELKEFYQVEMYHQNFIQNHPNQSYVRGVSIPRYQEFQSRYELYKKTEK